MLFQIFGKRFYTNISADIYRSVIPNTGSYIFYRVKPIISCSSMWYRLSFLEAAVL